MTPEQLEKQSREAVIAYLQDSSVRLECSFKTCIAWMRKEHEYVDTALYYYRIAQPKCWYRVALCSTGEIINACSKLDDEELIKSNQFFIKWITERIEYDPSTE